MRRRTATAESFWSPSLIKKLTNVGPRVRNLRGGATSQGLVASKFQRTVEHGISKTVPENVEYACA